MKPGDVVRLKCGGSRMVIAELSTYQSQERPTWWLCHWQDGEGHHCAANYYECELEPVSEGIAAAVALQNAAHAIDAIARERDEWKAKAGKYESEAHDWRSKADELQGALDVVSKQLATAMKAWRLLGNYADCQNNGVTYTTVRDFIRDNRPPKE